MIKELIYKYPSSQWFIQLARKAGRGLYQLKEMNLTRTTLMLIASLAVVAAIFSPSLSAAFSDPGEGGDLVEPTVYNLYAGQTTLIGHVLVWNDGDQICVRYLLDEPGWVMVETHVEMGDEVSDIPQTKSLNPIPGRFSQCDHYDIDAMTTEDEFLFPIDGEMNDGTVIIAAHAAVVHISDGQIDRGETAWTATEIGMEPFPGNNWATFVEYEINPIL